ncbi:MAG TPA: D-Ala-D-Ala carboxypeptidase family metallohydrolase [Chthoniobacteraceae bacterium]|nr:D-Ala-D-Ala carboxypeptidase family metallohydrolase [Chthoniobacteraceae bacterium]
MKVVDGLSLGPEHRRCLRPGEALTDSHGNTYPLPRFFYEVPTWAAAKELKLTPHFSLAELITVDCREASFLFRQSPLYVPCAVSVLARYLEEFRSRVDAPVYVSANGGYRSPSHQWDRMCPGAQASPHHWASAADIYRIGDTWLDSGKSIERHARIAASMGSEIFVRPFGAGQGHTDDHLHLDLGFLTLVPRGYCEL